ncbi:putative methyltransferase PMT11 [Morus notabilis]|uniref:Methyltransferase n=1 Tax=Morus notabilis TaxID=981085 RepID=W9RZG6_9ROSA|nr:probable methyltransferase PMT11 [Morus notabilis]EXC19389.1 putative methyltransferase PMT11 [Morus notabilis]
MKSLNNGDLLRPSFIVKIAISLLVSATFFYLGKIWAENLEQLVFYTPRQTSSVSISPNFNASYNITLTVTENTPPPPPPVLPPPPPEAEQMKRFGIVDKNGTMSDEFEVGEFDPDEVVENWSANGTEIVESEGSNSGRVRVEKFKLCPSSKSEYIPCLDNEGAIWRLKSTERGEKFERHCPKADRVLNCLVPPPKKYKSPIPWPQSRDQVWYNNVPHKRLVDDKGGQNWVSLKGDKFTFPGGGTQFIHGADQYLDHISKMVPDIAFGRNTRVVLDVGCGVASFGAYLLSQNVLTMSVAPKDVHENQIQFALERGVPAMVAAFATHRLLYPSQAFDLIHCSRCRINWTRDDGILLLEVDRMLRTGGYFVWAAQPVYKHEEVLGEQWEEMLNLTTRLCWEFVKKDGYNAIWKKPLNNSCYLNREEGTQPPLCDPNDDPDKVWYTDLKACITRFPENGYGANVTKWPERLQTPPDRLQSIQFDAYISRKELFTAEHKYWKDIISGYVRAYWKRKSKFRNVMDMKAGFGGFAAALMDHGMDAWVMNVVPVSGPNTLPVIYDRGLIGVMHDWCEPFDTYPRTYDFLHASGLFSVEKKRCNVSTIMLEMDRILRPGGKVYIRDSVSVMDELREIGNAMGWRITIRDTAEGPHASYRLFDAEKRLLHK